MARDANNRTLSDVEMQSLIEALRGTCDDIDKHLPDGVDFEDLTAQDCQALDEAVMKCDNCDWWVESELIDDNGWCDECIRDYG